MIDNAATLGLANSDLIQIDERHQLLPDVAAAFQQLQQACFEHSIDCQLVSSYRSFERQLAIWNNKWQGNAPLYNANGMLLDTAALSDEEKVHAILTWSALPGGSRHHWGTDIDVYDKTAVKASGISFELVDAEYTQQGPCYALSEFIGTHGEAFGFSRPFMAYRGGVATERWHLSYTPIAKEFEAVRNLSGLHHAISHADMLGKDVVLAMLDELYPRYVLNRGKA